MIERQPPGQKIDPLAQWEKAADEIPAKPAGPRWLQRADEMARAQEAPSFGPPLLLAGTGDRDIRFRDPGGAGLDRVFVTVPCSTSGVGWRMDTSARARRTLLNDTMRHLNELRGGHGVTQIAFDPDAIPRLKAAGRALRTLLHKDRPDIRQNREIELRDGIISDLQDRLATLEQALFDLRFNSCTDDDRVCDGCRCKRQD
jgi:hypothetical protein